MSEVSNRRNQPIKGAEGPVLPGSILYRILQRIAREIAQALNEARGTKHEPGNPSERQ
jgi:hypothetical protein